MGVQKFNVNTYAVIDYTHRLEKLSRSAFPMAVRGTLNAAAFDVKTNTLQESAKKHFIQRAPTFFRRFTSVDKATGFEVNAMAASVGFTAQGETKAQTPVSNMAKQESGGAIAEELDYFKQARGGNLARPVVRSNRFDKEKFLSGKFKRAGGTTKSRFIASAYASLNNKKRMFFKSKNGVGFTMQVTSIQKLKRGDIRITSKLLSMNRDHRPIHIRATKFSFDAAMATVPKMNDMYVKEANKQFDKILK